VVKRSSSAPAIYTIGIAGGTGSGKTTISQQIADRIGHHHVLLLPHDMYYRDLSYLPVKERESFNFDHPDSLETSLLISHINLLLKGKTIEAPVYDFSTHTRLKQTKTIKPKPILIVEGVFVLSHEKLRDMLALRVFIDADSDLRLIRRLNRDVANRGRSYESVIKQYMATVKPMYKRFGEPSKWQADIIFTNNDVNSVVADLLILEIEKFVPHLFEKDIIVQGF
jgi:uridine kinase